MKKVLIILFKRIVCVCMICFMTVVLLTACSGNKEKAEESVLATSNATDSTVTKSSLVGISVQSSVIPYDGTNGAVDISKTSLDKLGFLCNDLYLILNKQGVASDIVLKEGTSESVFANKDITIVSWDNVNDGFALREPFGLKSVLSVDYGYGTSKETYTKGEKYTSDVTSIDWYLEDDGSFYNFYYLYGKDDARYIKVWYTKDYADKNNEKPSDIFDKCVKYISAYGYQPNSSEPFYYELGPSQVSEFKKVDVSDVTPFTSILAKSFSEKGVKISDIKYLKGFDFGKLKFDDGDNLLSLRIIDSLMYNNECDSYRNKASIGGSIFDEALYDSEDSHLTDFVASRDGIFYQCELGTGDSVDVINTVLRK